MKIKSRNYTIRKEEDVSLLHTKKLANSLVSRF